MVCLGEILWDCLPTGKVMGGAQLNMAVQMKNLGLKPTLISAVGEDDLGDELLARIMILGVNDESIAQIQKYPTSEVTVTLDKKGKATYDIKKPVAWDAIPIEKSHFSAVKDKGLVFGSMAQRMDDVTMKSLDRLVKSSSLNFFDANFRMPHTTKEIVLKYLPISNIFKINEEELPILQEWMGIDCSEEEAMKQVVDNYDLDTFILTKGEEGSIVLQGDVVYSHPGFSVKVEDTVGCGDAFTAGFVYGLSEEWGIEMTTKFASAVSAVVATKKGGCCDVTIEEINKILLE